MVFHGGKDPRSYRLQAKSHGGEHSRPIDSVAWQL
jgi:hypothetical protein